MKHFLSVVVAMLATLALTGSIALAEHKRTTCTFENDVMVNSTMVKAGTYELVFDSKTDQLSIKKENGKTVATTVGHLEQRPEKVERTEIDTVTDGNTAVLTSIQFAGQRQVVVIGNPAAGR